MVRQRFVASAFTLLMAASLVSVAVDALGLRGGSETWRLLGQATEAATAPAPLQEKSLQWIQTTGSDNTTYHSDTISKIAGDQAIVIFHDRSTDPFAKAEAALVSFDVRSNANCVVSVCGTLRNWYLGSTEQCWDLKIAPKSSDPEKNGLIKRISAAYTATRPAAVRMYLKFDALNYIDGSVCHYEVLAGSKAITTEQLPTAEE